MTLIEILHEEFVGYKKQSYGSKSSDFQILKKPTLKEIRDLVKEENPKSFRILVSKENYSEYYFFNGDLLHYEVANLLKKDRDSFYNGYVDKNLRLEKMGSFPELKRMKDKKKIEKEIYKALEKTVIKM